MLPMCFCGRIWNSSPTVYNKKSPAEAELFVYKKNNLSLGVLAILFDIVNIVSIAR